MVRLAGVVGIGGCWGFYMFGVVLSLSIAQEPRLGFVLLW